MEQLRQNILKLIGNEGEWSIVIEDLDRQKQIAINENRIYLAASIIKLPIMAAAFKLVGEGTLSLDDEIELKRGDIVGGAGVLQHLTPGITLSIYDLITLMIIHSDNTATNIIIESIGKRQIQQMMDELGMKDSRFYNKLMTIPVKTEGSNVVTATDVATFLRKLVNGQCISFDACKKMLEIMKKQQIHYIASAFPEKQSSYVDAIPIWEFASKTGHITGSFHDVGILYVSSRTVIITVLSERVTKQQSLVTLSKIGKEVYQYMLDE